MGQAHAKSRVSVTEVSMAECIALPSLQTKCHKKNNFFLIAVIQIFAAFAPIAIQISPLLTLTQSREM